MYLSATKLEDGQVVEPQRALTIAAEADVLVAGGGPAGIGAALGAARSGARTLLVERNGFLGGTATAGMMAIWNANLNTTTGFAHELIQHLIEVGGAFRGTATPFDPEKLKEVALEILDEAGVRLMLYTSVVAPIKLGDSVAGVVVESKSGRQALLGKVVVDCSGDGDVAVGAGAPHVVGRERDGKMRPMGSLFRMGGVDVRALVQHAQAHPEDFTPDPGFQLLDLENGVVRISGFFQEVEAARLRGDLDKNCHYLRFEGVNVQRGTIFVNSTRVYGVDGTNVWDMTRAEIESRRQTRQLACFINTLPGCKNAFVIDSSPSIGVRETRRIRGEAILTQDDIAAGRSYPDTVLSLKRRLKVGMELHSPDAGEGSVNDATARTASRPITTFEVPYGVLVPCGVEGLLVAGRCISQTHEADAFTRGMHCCMVIGQAAGVAAAIAAREGVQPRSVDLLRVQKELQRQGVDLGQQAARVQAAHLA